MFIKGSVTFLESNPLPRLENLNLPFELVIPFLENCPIKKLTMSLCDDPDPALAIVKMIKDCRPDLTFFSATAVHNPLVWVNRILVDTKIEVLRVGLVLNTDQAGIVVVNKVSINFGFICCIQAHIMPIGSSVIYCVVPASPISKNSLLAVFPIIQGLG